MALKLLSDLGAGQRVLRLFAQDGFRLTFATSRARYCHASHHEGAQQQCCSHGAGGAQAGIAAFQNRRPGALAIVAAVDGLLLYRFFTGQRRSALAFAGFQNYCVEFECLIANWFAKPFAGHIGKAFRGVAGAGFVEHDPERVKVRRRQARTLRAQ
jgi:hypothetical protein